MSIQYVVEKNTPEFEETRYKAWKGLTKEISEEELKLMYQRYTLTNGSVMNLFKPYLLLKGLPKPFSCVSLRIQPYADGKQILGVTWFCDLVFPALCPCLRNDLNGSYPSFCPTPEDLTKRDMEIQVKGFSRVKRERKIQGNTIEEKFEDVKSKSFKVGAFHGSY